MTTSKPITHIAGYRFVRLAALPELRTQLYTLAQAQGLKGTILLSPEGINVMLAGTADAIALFRAHLNADVRFVDMFFHVSVSLDYPFQRLKVKIKKEIITLRQSAIDPNQCRAPAISPTEFRRWLDEGREVTIVDTRNDYEYQAGAFDRAINPKLKDFSEFPAILPTLPRDKPVVMYCTGGVRCEKAALVMLAAGFDEVYQLEGGILNYFAKEGGAHYHGDCFVFDERGALNPKQFESIN